MDKNFCDILCCCCCRFCMDVGSDQEHDYSLPYELNNDDLFGQLIFILLPNVNYFHISIPSCQYDCTGRYRLNRCWNLLSDFTWLLKSYTLPFSWNLVRERNGKVGFLQWFNKMPLNTNLSHTVPHRSTLFHNALDHSKGNLLDSWPYWIMSSSAFGIMSFIAYVSIP